MPQSAAPFVLELEIVGGEAGAAEMRKEPGEREASYPETSVQPESCSPIGRLNSCFQEAALEPAVLPRRAAQGRLWP
jgi:hypothetical protein